MSFKRFLFTILLSVSLLSGAFVFLSMPSPAMAQDTGLATIGETANLSSADPRTIATRIINIALGLLGIIFVSLIVYAGFLYLTSGGDATKTQKAVGMIRNGIIGLVIILLSWALARYILTKLMEATGTGGGGGGSSGGTGGGRFGGGGGTTTFSIKSITPNGSVETKKVIVKIVFSKLVDAESAASEGMITVTRVSDGVEVEGTVQTSGSVVRFTPKSACPEPNTDRFCFDENTEYQVDVSPSLISASGQSLTCGGFSSECTGRFTSGTTVDLTPPEVTITEPLDGFGVSANSIVNVRAVAKDETGVGYVEFFDNGSIIGDDAPTGSTPKTFSASVPWDTAGLAIGSTRTLQASAYDVDSGSSQSTAVSVIIRSEHCFNDMQDEGETGIDCGGVSTSVDYCGACTGGSCTADTDCASGLCEEGVCVERPIITYVDPADGAPGSYVTIRGRNFGSNGSVYFLGSAGEPIKAIPPVACSDAGVSTWASEQVVIEVPDGAQSGPLRLMNALSGLSDDTNALPDPVLPDFIVNETYRPGICAIVPSEGEPNDRFTVYGTNFGSTASAILFGDRTLVSTSWAEHYVESSIPSVGVGLYDVSVQVGTAISNAVSMNVVSAESGGAPAIVSIDPAQGPIGTMVTITGSNFGSSVGSVFFERVGTGETALADVSLPEACTNGYWKDKIVIVKVPKIFTQVGTGELLPGSYAVYIKTSRPTAPISNKVNFLVNTDPLTPGICSVVPRVAPVGTNISIYGEGFTTGPGTIRYFQNMTDSGVSWNGETVVSAIPVGAQSGALTVQPAGSPVSNPYVIEVRNCNESSGICSSGETCCSNGSCIPEGSVCSEAPTRAMYAWQFSTGIIPRAPRVVEQCSEGSIPSPSPWSNRTGGDQACVNARPVVLFTTLIDATTVTRTSGNVELYRCTGTGTDACATTASTPEALTDIRMISDTESRNAIILVPPSLTPSTWYQVRLKTGIRSTGEQPLPMAEGARSCGSGYAYCYTFKTREDTTPCEIGSVEVAPDPYRARFLDLPIEYEAVPKSKGDLCQVLACETYPWSWGVSDARATVTHALNPDLSIGGEACQQQVTPVMETGDSNPVQISAQATGVTGIGNLFIKLVDPIVTSYGPNCDTACVNAAIWAVFNVPMDKSTFTRSTIRLELCKNESCQETTDMNLSGAKIELSSIPDTSGTENRYLLVSPLSGGATMLSPGKFYRVTLLTNEGAGILSESGLPLSGLNVPGGFSWIFRVKTGEDAYCKPNTVTVTPKEKYETSVGARQGFLAIPRSEPDACSEQEGQVLMSLSAYAWSIDDTSVAKLLFNGTLDTISTVPDGCNEQCTKTGAQGQYGKVAKCGDGIVQTVNASYCVSGGRTPSGKSCVILPAGSSGSEECDETSDYCNSRCLWEPVKSVSAGGTCGDGTKQATEDCDLGSVCMGASAASGILDGADCTKSRTACTTAGGICEPRETRGCSVFCRHLGSRAGGSTCGNEDVSDGEDCDDGNLKNGDGCSSNCLIEGSSSELYALCGNGKLEPGESCELTGGVLPSACDPKTCLNKGLTACASPTENGCCGNGKLESGEDCDDGNTSAGDWCSPICLLEGSSVSYEVPSFCGDGVRGLGEAIACEDVFLARDGVDAYQIAETVGEGAVPDGETRMSTQLHATYESLTGDATYGLQCGYSSEDQCEDDSVGLTNAGCCSYRPELTATVPLDGETNVCRNATIYGDFNMLMDQESLSSSLILATNEAECSAENTIAVTELEKPKGVKGMIARAWNAVRVFFGGRDAYAQVLCSGGITGRLSFVEMKGDDGRSFTRFYFTLNHAIDANETVTVIFKGDPSLEDNTADSGKVGIKTASGVVSGRDYRWSFTTGEEICKINRVTVEDTNRESPGLFLRGNEEHVFTALAESWHANRMVVISPTSEYAWKWQNWTLSNRQIVELKPEVLTGDLSLSLSTESLISKRTNGTGYVNARVIITADSVGTVSTIGNVIQGTRPIVVNVCENPWPSRSEAPFRDAMYSPSLAGTPFESGPYFNFAFMYCRDAGEIGEIGDLPSLVANAVPTNEVDSSQGIMRQYLFTFAEPELKKDAIGVRIASNPLHLSPEEWYLSKGFVGSPQSLTIDGYQAIRDGRTVYISAVSTEGPGTELYSNIYIISYNDDAGTITRQIYDALLSSFAFNQNIQSDITGVCQDLGGSLISGDDGAPVYCFSDIDCRAYDPADQDGNGSGSVTCANFKAKIQRDLVRLADFEKMTRKIEASKVAMASYPSLSEGSYIGGMSTSLWPSWKEALGGAVGSLPIDPLNQFVTCGICESSRTACSKDSDCPVSGESCMAKEGFDPLTCWNSSARQFACAKESESVNPTSRIYMYEAQDTGARYRLSSEFEVRPDSEDATDAIISDWWWPPLVTTVRECVAGSLRGVFCSSDTDCRRCPNGICIETASEVAGYCQPIGASYRYFDICQGETYGQSTTCGDGILSSSATNPEVCETVGPTSSKYVSCTTPAGSEGYQRQICNACREYVKDPSSSCTAGSWCGNGRVDGSCGGDVSKPCQSNADCSGSSCVVTEICDDGAQNGTYGHCNLSCDGYGALCGDGMISGGEVCDNGQNNAEWVSASSYANSCNLSCTDRSAYCGDLNVDTPFETCDGNKETTEKAICSDGKTICDTDANCPSGTTCGATASTAACPRIRVCTGIPKSDGFVTGFSATNGSPCTSSGQVTACQNAGGTCSTETFQTFRARSCSKTTCSYDGAWGSCRVVQRCGNGVVEGAEECDDQNDVETDSCTSTCKKNVCGDGLKYKGVEECDLGSANGTGCISSAEYGSTCTSCSTSCKAQLTQGGFCGDGVVNAGTAEQCDGTDTVDSRLTCTSLGYDYLKPGLRKIQCNQSCGYTGCASCGDVPPEGASTSDYEGRIEGILFDTMFQQYVPNARVVLFYRGLQIAVTSSDENGYFEFKDLDIHVGCDKYRLMVDSYTDNPNTTLDESKRGGYQPIETPIFSPHTSNIANENGTSGMFTSIVLARPGMAKLVSHPTKSYQIPQFNMLPRLYDNEYIVQLWWTPKQSAAVISSRLKTALAQDVARGDGLTTKVDAIYTSYVPEMHDLVVRLPYTYTPGTYQRCTISRQLDYLPGTSNRAVNGRNPSTGALGSTGIDGTPYYGMYRCTNKIRATLSHTCQVIDRTTKAVKRETTIGCATGKMCYFMGIDIDTTTENFTCNGSAEPERQGTTRVFEGQEGAYLSCFHAEWLGIDDARSKEVDCGNFIVAPQTVFIHAETGQFDVMVSKYKIGIGAETLHYGSSDNENSIREWLVNRNAYLVIYDKNGLRYTINPVRSSVNKYWSANDNQPIVCLAEENRKTDTWTAGMSTQLIAMEENSYSPVWTPFSIMGGMPSTNAIKLWNKGDAGADFHFFSDLMHQWTMNASAYSSPCWERACIGKASTDVNPAVPKSGKKICQGATNVYADPNQAASKKACNEASKAACPAGTTCATQVSSNPDSEVCVQICTSDADCTKDEYSYCGGNSGGYCAACPTCNGASDR